MKNVLLVFAILLAFNIGAQELDQKTKNIATAKYLGAKDNFKQEKYEMALSQITEIEELTGTPTIATALDLKVQVLIGMKKYEAAEEELDILMGLQLTPDILQNAAGYEKSIKDGIETRERLAREKVAREAQREKEKKETLYKLVNAAQHFSDQDCKECHGTGKLSYTKRVACSRCDYGRVRAYDFSLHKYVNVNCSTCNGTNRVNKEFSKTCPDCDGEGEVFTYTGSEYLTNNEINKIKDNYSYYRYYSEKPNGPNASTSFVPYDKRPIAIISNQTIIASLKGRETKNWDFSDISNISDIKVGDTNSVTSTLTTVDVEFLFTRENFNKFSYLKLKLYYRKEGSDLNLHMVTEGDFEAYSDKQSL